MPSFDTVIANIFVIIILFFILWIILQTYNQKHQMWISFHALNLHISKNLTEHVLFYGDLKIQKK